MSSAPSESVSLSLLIAEIDPALASAHGELRQLLRAFPAESENEAERLHVRHQWAMRRKHRTLP